MQKKIQQNLQQQQQQNLQQQRVVYSVAGGNFTNAHGKQDAFVSSFVNGQWQVQTIPSLN